MSNVVSKSSGQHACPEPLLEGRQICLSFKFVGLVVQSVNYKVLKEVIVWEIL